MGPNGWATYRTTQAAIQKWVNWFAAAIHAADPNVLVTNGPQTFDYCSNVSGKIELLLRQRAAQRRGAAERHLDFYQVHYYTSNGTSNSRSSTRGLDWGLDKKLVMGEFAAQATDGRRAERPLHQALQRRLQRRLGLAVQRRLTWP